MINEINYSDYNFNNSNEIIKYNDCDLKKNLYCLNCGKKGHIIKKCKEPQTSYGIICFKITGDWSIFQSILQIKYYKTNYNTHLNNINLYWFNNKNKDIKDDINEYIEKLKKDVKILLIRRQHSIGYIEFIRGRYEIDNESSINKLLELMTDEERYYIINNNFNTVWEGLWKNTSRSKLYEKEFIKSNLLHCLEAAASIVLPSALKGVRISLPQVHNVYILDLQHNRVLFLFRHSIFPLF